MRRPLEPRIYELARKYVGEQDRPFVVGIDTLQRKVGSSAPAKKLRFLLKEIIANGHIPDYRMTLDARNVRFSKIKRRPSGQTSFNFG